MSARAFLKERSLGRIVAGHPWVYESDLAGLEKAPADGGEITVRTENGRYVGDGFYNSRSRIPIRVFSRSKESLDEAFFRKRILEAKALRENWHDVEGESRNDLLPATPAVDRDSPVEAGRPGPLRRQATAPTFSGPSLPPACRLVWSEADFLPGLIVDCYGDALVVQTLTLALDQRKDVMVELLKEIYQPSMIVERNDVSSRAFEGLPLQKSILWGEQNSVRRVVMGGVEFEIDLIQGQKTGAYLDQIANQQQVEQLARGKRVLDCFAYHGGFALHTALGGASHIEAWDVSEEAVRVCRRNTELNPTIAGQVIWKTANAFDEFKVVQRANRRFDLIILDPPSFTRSREKLSDALRGYKEIHLRALQLLDPGGLLATFCCSHHVDAETFRAVILDAAFDARKLLRLRQTFSQSCDHPIIPAIPETEYLKGFLFQIV